MRLTEHRSRALGLADLLLYDALIDDGVMLLQDGALMAAWSFRGPDMASATNTEMAALSARLNSTLKFGTGWMIQCDAIRSRAPVWLHLPGTDFVFLAPLQRRGNDGRFEVAPFEQGWSGFAHQRIISAPSQPPPRLATLPWIQGS